MQLDRGDKNTEIDALTLEELSGRGVASAWYLCNTYADSIVEFHC
ncbi:hypothetical protein [Mesorhizobium sp. B4-1-4]|nr:hypothetical protein [Mesorhizobium sp. B4-1-4]